MFPNQYNNATENYPNPDIEVNLSDILDSLDPGRAKAQDDLENGDEEENGTENIIQEKISITPGMSFDTKALAIEKSKAFFAQNFHPFITASSGGDSKGPDDKSKGRIRFVCTHGHRRKYIATDIRPKQRVNQIRCQAGFNLNEQVNGTWKVGSKVIIEHIGHIHQQNPDHQTLLQSHAVHQPDPALQTLSQSHAVHQTQSQSQAVYKPDPVHQNLSQYPAVDQPQPDPVHETLSQSQAVHEGQIGQHCKNILCRL